MTFMAVILAKNVSKVYENGSRKTYALQNVSFEIRKGEFAVVLGQSGKKYASQYPGRDRLTDHRRDDRE